MNIFSALLIAIVTTIILLSSLGNLIFLKSEEVKEREIFQKAKNFYEVLKRIEKIEASNFLHEHFLGLSNVSIKNGILSIELEGEKFNFFIGYSFEETEIKNKGRYCILKISEKIKVFSCEEYLFEDIGECNVLKCKLKSRDCLGPNKMCIGDGFCNTFIKENCRNSVDCDCKNLGSNYICCPENPNSDEKGCLKLESKKKKGEECYCNEECGENLECNPVDPSFTSYKKACCEKGKVWNGTHCIDKGEIKKYTIIFVPIGFSENEYEDFKNVAQESFNFFVEKSPFGECKNKEEIIEAIYLEPQYCQETCDDLCGSCFEVAYDCAVKSKYKNIIDHIVGVCKGSKCLEKTPAGGCGLLNVPIASVYYEALFIEKYVVAHELGHNFGLCHINECGAEGGCVYPCPNAEDCNEPDRKKDIMSYCPKAEKYGPKGYQHIKKILEDFLEYCKK